VAMLPPGAWIVPTASMQDGILDSTKKAHGLLNRNVWNDKSTGASDDMELSNSKKRDASNESRSEDVGCEAFQTEVVRIDAKVSDMTTVIMKEIPLDFARDDVVELLDTNGFSGEYDFVYLPHNFRAEKSFGYAFINLVSSSIAERFLSLFTGFEDWGIPSDKVAEVSHTQTHQGLEAHIRRYRDSPTMHENVPDHLKPSLYAGGLRIAFPPPTKVLKAPRARMVNVNFRT